MKVHQVLTLIAPALQVLISAGINPRDVQHLELYGEYLRLSSEGHKMTYIEAVLCDTYDIKRTKFYELIKNFDQAITL